LPHPQPLSKGEGSRNGKGFILLITNFTKMVHYGFYFAAKAQRRKVFDLLFN